MCASQCQIIHLRRNYIHSLKLSEHTPFLYKKCLESILDILVLVFFGFLLGCHCLVYVQAPRS